MKRQIYIVIACCIFHILSKAQTAPHIQKEISFGGSGIDMAQCIRSTNDSGFIIAGQAKSVDGEVSGNHGEDDYWIIKLNKSLRIQWKKTLGGSGSDIAQDIQQTPDGGYIVAGTSTSNDGNVTGHHSGVFVNSDYWIVKLDSKGNIQWQKSLGGSGDDFARSIQFTSDKGYVVAGWSNSTNGDVKGNHGGNDYWIVKLDSAGNTVWQKCLGGSGSDIANVIINTDSGFLVAGGSSSTDGNVKGNHGDYDFWIVKLNSKGNIQSQSSFGGSHADMAFAVQQTFDKNFVIAGRSESSDGNLSSNKGNEDYWVIKINGKYKLQWQSSFGGGANDDAYSVQQTQDSGYVVCGYADSQNGDVIGSHGNTDMWVLKLNASGKLQWQKCMGGTGADYGYSILQTKDNKYMIAGTSNSTDGDVTGNHGDYDYWLVKLGAGTTKNNLVNAEVNNNSVAARADVIIKVAPNPVTSILRIQSNTAFQNGVISISDLNGKLVLTRSLDLPSTGFVDLPVNTLHKGTYILEIAANGFKRSFTIIRQ